MRLLIRREYDTRFIQFESSPRPSELSKRIEEEIHRSYPGNHGRYRTFSRSLGEGLYAAAITSTGLTESLGGKPLVIPLLMLPKILLKIKRRNLQPGPERPLLLWTGDEGELIRFDGDGRPVSSRICTEPFQGEALWCFIGPASPLKELPAGGIPLYRRSLPPGAGRVNTKVSKAPGRPGIGLFVLLFLFLLSASGFLLRYELIQEEQLRALKREVSRRQNREREAADLRTEIESLRQSPGPAQNPGPYLILTALTAPAPEDLSIRRFSLEGSTFTLEGSAADPINFSGALSESGRFTGIDISRVRRTDEGISFLLKGDFHE